MRQNFVFQFYFNFIVILIFIIMCFNYHEMVIKVQKVELKLDVTEKKLLLAEKVITLLEKYLKSVNKIPTKRYRSSFILPNNVMDKSFISLLTKYETRIRGRIRNIARSSEDCEDLYQSASLKAWQYFYTLKDHNKFYPWFIKIVKNTRLNFYYNELLIDILYYESGISYFEFMHDLFKLPKQMKNVMLMRISGMKHKEISKQLNIAETTARTLFHLARKRIL